MPTTEWGVRAAALYDATYARRYRTMDDEIRHGELVATFGTWVRSLCESLGRPIVVLDLGCGTGRYFWAVRGARELVGIDASPAMIGEARQPVAAGEVTAGTVTLIEGDFLTYPLEPDRFDLVFSIGVLGEHTPFDRRVASLVHRWLAPGGLFAFTAVHRSSFSVPRTLQRRFGEWIEPMLSGMAAQGVRRQLLSGGLYVDEPYLREVLSAAGLIPESITSHLSSVHLHCLTVARKAA